MYLFFCLFFPSLFKGLFFLYKSLKDQCYEMCVYIYILCLIQINFDI